MENRTCQNCKKDFTIEPDDFSFYEKMKVPAPTWCPECRFMRRLCFLNWFTMYKRNCDSCQKSIISTLREGTPYKVYCAPCWWADTWDGTEYGQEYDETRPFLEQMIGLKNKSTFMAVENLYSSLVNSPYVNAAAYQKDCFMVFNADYGERNAYCMVYAHVSESLDGYRIKNSELCYECIGIYKCYRCIFSEELDSCTDVLFSRSCSGCTNCVGCINLRNKSNCIFNVQYSKEEYKEKIASFHLDTREGIENLRKQSYDFWMKNPHRATIGNSLNINTTGDFVYESKNTKDGYMISGAEDCRYVQMLTMGPTKSSYDYTNWGNGAENLYECLTVGEGAYNNKFCVQCWPNAMDNEYCLYAIQAKDCFGCVNLKRKQYCILNKEYSKEEYFTLKEKIIEDMKNNPYTDAKGRIWPYGEQLPFSMSPFAYNETMARYYFPITENEAKEKKMTWYDIPDTEHEITLQSDDLPLSSTVIPDEITKEIIACTLCAKGYRFNELEIYLHRKINIPLPDKCWKCRFKRRFDRVNKPTLYNRNCMKCTAPIGTSYAPDRPEIIYCEKCYQEAVV
ncbi:MAG: hypothetical protein V4665_04130 [Patescibacteria group bacterium]